MLNQSPQILLIEGDATLLEITAFRLELLGYQVITYDSAEKALDWLKDQLPSTVIVDYVLPAWTVLSLLIASVTTRVPVTFQ